MTSEKPTFGTTLNTGGAGEEVSRRHAGATSMRAWTGVRDGRRQGGREGGVPALLCGVEERRSRVGGDGPGEEQVCGAVAAGSRPN